MKSNRHKKEPKTILKQKNKVGLLLLDFKTYSKLTASDNSRGIGCNRHRAQQNRIGFRNRSTHGQIILNDVLLSAGKKKHL